jgi:3-isopropylmalate/(R)-2-methylmalate dehydratase small subunit
MGSNNGLKEVNGTMVLRGRVWKLGDDVDTDQLLPGRYMTLTDPQELAPHCLEVLWPEFHTQVRTGDIVLAGENMGCGSSREHAPIALRALGISCLVARSFARIFFRNCINLGLPALACPEAYDGIENGDEVVIDVERGTITNLSRPFHCAVSPLPPFMAEIIAAGGMTAYVRRRILESAAQTGKE